MPEQISRLQETVGRTESGKAWLHALPSLIHELRDQWSLRLSPAFAGGSCSWVAPAELPDGSAAVLKIGWPHREMFGEAAALKAWAGQGAVRLLAEDDARHALLLERCSPGQALSRPADLPAACELLRGLWAAPVPENSALEHVGDVTAEWAGLVEQRMATHRPPFDPGLVALGAKLLRELPAGADRAVMVHGDFNPGNILAAQRLPWLAIDPKPMLGDPAYDPWPLIEQVDDPFAHADPGWVLRHRVAEAAELLGLDPVRIIAWAVARRVETALWAVSFSDIAGGRQVLAEAETLARIGHL